MYDTCSMFTTHRGEEARAGKQAASCTVVGVESVRRRAHAEPDLRIEDPFTVYRYGRASSTTRCRWERSGITGKSPHGPARNEIRRGQSLSLSVSQLFHGPAPRCLTPPPARSPAPHVAQLTCRYGVRHDGVRVRGPTSCVVRVSVGIVVYDIVRSGRSSQLRDVTSNEYEIIGGFVILIGGLRGPVTSVGARF